jgi:cytochrome c oxidase assembly factor CtaG/mono/diheme cytochrome c family protein
VIALHPPLRWDLEPLPLLGLGLVAFAYGRGVRTLWRGERGARGRRGVSPQQVAAFAGGLAAAAAALVSPLASLAEELFSAHMTQHLLLILVAAPLLVLGSPALPLLVALPPSWRRRVRSFARSPVPRTVARSFGNPLAIWFLQTAVLWGWHAPPLFDAAVSNEALHALEHASMLGSALLFWWVVVPSHRRRRLARGPDVAYVGAAAVQGGALGALLTFAPTPLYPAYAGSLRFGLTPLEDQQLAGLIMWVPAFFVYLGAAAALFLGWLRTLDAGSGRPLVSVKGSKGFGSALFLAAIVAATVQLSGGASSSAQTSPSPAPTALAPGQRLYLGSCAFCHGVQGEGSPRGPSLRSAGPADVDFMLSTGRMPVNREVGEAQRRPPRFDRREIDQIVEYVSSFGFGPEIPQVDLADVDLGAGSDLYQENCAACHSSTGVGAALTSGAEAPSLLASTPLQVAEAIRVGPGTMPVFSTDSLSDDQMGDVVGYVVALQHPEDRGGLGLLHIGPIVEGFIAWAFAMVALLLVARAIGERG